MRHLSRLEAEAIEIMREVVSEAENPVMLYSVGKDSATGRQKSLCQGALWSAQELHRDRQPI